MEIVPVPAFADNYLWLVHDADSGETLVDFEHTHTVTGVALSADGKRLVSSDRHGFVTIRTWFKHTRSYQQNRRRSSSISTVCRLIGSIARWQWLIVGAKQSKHENPTAKRKSPRANGR